jgi:hypothetical protein
MGADRHEVRQAKVLSEFLEKSRKKNVPNINEKNLNYFKTNVVPS